MVIHRPTEVPFHTGGSMATQALRLPRSDAIRFPTGARCIAYVRVSTERQAGETKVSPQTQLDACHALAAERGLTIPVDCVIQHNESGAHLERLHRLPAPCPTHPPP